MGKYIVKETKTGFKFDLKAINGETIATSEVYSSESSCLNGIESLKKNAPAANLEDQTEESIKKAVNPKFEVYVDKADEFRFRMKARNGEIIVASEGYKSKSSCLNGIESVRKNAADSDVVRENEVAKSSDSAAKSGKASKTKSPDNSLKSTELSQTKDIGSAKKTGGFLAAVKRFFGVK